ncbi:DnaD domain-containing protein, partial [Klebsiella variicola]|uniref:DnaD domain-containing protein n=2 Tax=Bacteria TaxID=2 RepID=UPI0011E3D7F3
LASKTSQDFKYWLQDFIQKGASQEEACQLILHALGIAIDRNKRNYGYVNAILKSWEQQNYLSVHEVLVNDKKQVSEHALQMTEEYQELGF